jgi:hypothetical protein
MDAAYLRAAHPKPFRIFGRRLLPFSLGHEILFQKFGNRFSVENRNEGDPPSIADALKGVFICSQPYHRAAGLERFSIPLRARFFACWFPGYCAIAFRYFHEYIVEHTEIPKFDPIGERSERNYGTPTVQAVKVSLMANLGMTEGEALNIPFSLAFWNHLAWLEGQGAIQIIDEAEKKRRSEIQLNVDALEARIRELKKVLFPEKEGPNGTQS